MKLTNKEIALHIFKNEYQDLRAPYLAYAEILVGSFVYSIISKQQKGAHKQPNYFVYDRNNEFYPMLIRRIKRAMHADPITYSKGYQLLSLRLEQGIFYISFFYQPTVKESIVIIKVLSKPPSNS